MNFKNDREQWRHLIVPISAKCHALSIWANYSQWKFCASQSTELLCDPTWTKIFILIMNHMAANLSVVRHGWPRRIKIHLT